MRAVPTELRCAVRQHTVGFYGCQRIHRLEKDSKGYAHDRVKVLGGDVLRPLRHTPEARISALFGPISAVCDVGTRIAVSTGDDIEIFLVKRFV